MITEYRVVKDRYFDSVFLMRVARRMTETAGIAQAAAVMATQKNLEVLAQAGFAGADALGATPNDLIVALRAERREQARAVLDRIDDWLATDRSESAETAVRSLDDALIAQPGTNLVLISVPGEYAAREARLALQRGLSVFLFSDNVSLEDETTLKRLAQERGLLVMGPDCGTAIIGGVGLGFANVVRRGPVGIVGASGTGTQEVTTLVHRVGSGISHAIGTGSHDLSDAVGGITALRALDALEADPATRVIVVVSKPPGKATLARVRERLRRSTKPVVTCFLGMSDQRNASDGVVVVHDLEAAAGMAVRMTLGERSGAVEGGPGAMQALVAKERAAIGPGQKYVRGVFAGGTFCYQAQQVLRDAGLAVHSNEPLPGAVRLEDPYRSTGHTLVDMGADAFTVGRPHPMIDSRLRAERVRAEAQDPEAAVLVLDFILGYGSSPDPAGELAGAIADARTAARRRGGYLSVVASVCGTAEDPQGLERQTKTLEDAGALVLNSSVQAARLAAAVAASLAQGGA